MATDLYTVLPGLEVSQDEILQAEMAAEKILSSRYPDLDLRQGTGLRDLVIRPSATLLALVNKAVIYYFSQNTLPGVTDNSPTEIVDKILSNWFVERKAGKKSVISARLFFATKKNITVGTEVFFSPDNIKKFYPVNTYSFSPAELQYESFSGEYYVDIDLVADKEGNDYDLTSGSLLYFSNFDAYFLRGEINYLREMASVTETNTNFIARTKTAVSTRNLINVPSIDARLREDFDYITAVTTVGYGDEEMYRDQVTVMAPPAVDPILIHIGGKTDVYTRVPLQTQVLQYPTDANGIAEVVGPYLELERSTISGGAEEDTVPVYRNVSVTNITFSGNIATVNATAHGFTVGQAIIISGATPTVYNGSFSVSLVSNPNTFTYVLPSTPVSVPTGTIIAKTLTAFEVTYPNRKVLNASFTKSGNVVTVTSSDHGVIAGRYVLLTGAAQSGYNGWFLVNTVTKDTLTVTNAATLSSPATGAPLLTLTNYMQDNGLSPLQTIHANFGVENANKTVSFTTLGFQGLDGIQTYMNQETRKVLAGDILARGYNIYYLSMNIIGYNSAPPSAVECAGVAKEYLDSLDPGAPFIMADLISLLNKAGVITIKTPIDVSYRYFHRDNIPPVDGVISDFLDPSDRTAIFMLESLTTANEYL